jgi:hypothetical protein
VDERAAEGAARAFLHALGISTDNESLCDTPRRMARAYLSAAPHAARRSAFAAGILRPGKEHTMTTPERSSSSVPV